MPIKVLVPNLGESIVEATVAQWFKKEGDEVASGEKLVELETDKVNLDVGAERGGILQKIEHQEGDDVKVGDVLGLIDDTKAGLSPTPKIENKKSTSAPKKIDQKQASMAKPLNGGEKENITPVARRMAEELGLNTDQIVASRPGERITKQDIQQIAKFEDHVEAAPDTASRTENFTTLPTVNPESQTVENNSTQSVPPTTEERVALSRRRRTIAQRLVEAQQTTAMLTTFNDVDMSAVNQIRKRRKEEFIQEFGVSLGISSFFVKASIQALRAFPMVNAEMRGDELIIKHYYDIGIAIGSEEGLVVPVIRHADQMTFGEIEKAIKNLIEKTHNGTLSVEDLRGGTFTITNGGVFGSLMSTPILNPPQVAILGLHRIEDRPIAQNNQVVVRPMMYMALSYDHRVIDGREAVQFLVKIKDLIENPELMLLEL